MSGRSVSVNVLPESYVFPETVVVSDQLREEIVSDVWYQIICGNCLEEDLVDYFSEDWDEVDDDSLSVVVSSLVECRRSQLLGLKEAGLLPVDRLGLVFDELKGLGVLGLANFSCCGTCGSGEAYDLIYEDDSLHGYVYFHQQDTERLVESGSTYLGYGVKWSSICSEAEYDAMSGEDRNRVYVQACRELGELVRPVFEKHGVGFEWDGDVSVRMLITGVDDYVVDFGEVV